MTIYLLRHPETEWNGEWRFQGRTDIPVSEKGMESLKRALPMLCSLPVEIIYTSPLQRARVVADEINKVAGIPYVVDERIIEAHCGRWEGKKVPDLMKEEPKLLSQWYADPYDRPMPGGETYGQVEKRTSAFLEEVILKGKSALVVSHGIAIVTMLRHILDIPKEKTSLIRVENLGLARIEVDNIGKGFIVANPLNLFKLS
jgi:broad specificity phosphatase PhoE